VQVYAEHRRDQQAKKNKKYGWFAAAVVVAAIVIAVNVNDSSPQHEAAQPAHSAGIPAPVATPVPTPDATRTYSVPHYMTEELSRDRAAVEAAQAAADSLDKQLTVARTELEAKQAEVQLAQTELDSLGAKIERARPYVSNGDDAAVNRFNNDVAKYNRMVKRVQQMVAGSDALVDPYNALLARTKAKSDEANRLVDAYNRKLAQVGH
jgi:peptidoglycan hydrolase CwlO-like protein